MNLQDLINTFEEVKKNVYLITRGDKTPILIQFNDDNFFHLVGLHKTNINLFMPKGIKSKTKMYKYLKGHIDKFNNILLSEVNDNELLNNRITTFHNILDLLNGERTSLYDLCKRTDGSMYDGDFGILKIYEDINCLLGLKISTIEDNIIKCAPQSWMSSNKVNYLIKFKKPIYMEKIAVIPLSFYNKPKELVSI